MSGILYSTYDPVSGEFLSNQMMGSAEEVLINTIDGEMVLSGKYDLDTEYVDVANGHVAIDRPVVPVMDGTTYDLSDLPEGAKLIVTDEVAVSTDVEAQLDTLELTDAGKYRVRSSSPFPAVDFDIEVVVP